MRLLFISPYPPTPIRRRPYELLRRLADRHDVTLATPAAGPADGAALDDLRLLGIDVRTRPIGRARRAASLAAAAVRGLPLQARFDWHPAMAADIRELIAGPTRRRFDAVHVEHLRGACYGLVVRASAPSLPVVWDAVDCISRLFAQAARGAATRRARVTARLGLARTRRYEGGLPGRFARTAITSEADRDVLLALALNERRPPGAPIAVIPNGVDLGYFEPPAASTSRPASRRDPATVLFTGKLGYHANVAAAVHLVRNVMPRVWSARPDARVVLAGSDPAPAVRALAMAPLGAAHGGVTVTGALLDLRPCLHAATVAAVPLVYGVGIQNKILEAMACAVPVVASSAAASALTAQPGHDLLLADTPDDLAAAIVALLDDPSRAAAVGAAGRAYVVRAHGWDRAVARFEALYESAAASAATLANRAD